MIVLATKSYINKSLKIAAIYVSDNAQIDIIIEKKISATESLPIKLPVCANQKSQVKI